jgi:hypothetical protein
MRINKKEYMDNKRSRDENYDDGGREYKQNFHLGKRPGDGYADNYENKMPTAKNIHPGRFGLAAKRSDYFEQLFEKNGGRTKRRKSTRGKATKRRRTIKRKTMKRRNGSRK